MNELREEIIKLLEEVGSYGKTPANGISRLLYTKEWLGAQTFLKEKMISCGLETEFDDIGNLFGRLKGTKYPDETILSGSHVDTVEDGGHYDGQFGIVAAIIAIKHLKENYGDPLRNLEVVSLAEEEGSRFPYTFWGSKNVVGLADRKDVEHIKDFNGVPFVEAMQEAGFTFRDGEKKVRNDLKAFVEIHNEQGGVLEAEQKSVGVVHSIVGQRRFNITLDGLANHAGTTPMGYRKDTLYAASDMVYKIITAAKIHGDPLVATVGHIEVTPNIVNVVPGKALFTIDVRHTNKEALVSFTKELTNIIHQSAEEHDVSAEIDMWMDEDPVPMNDDLVNLMKKYCEDHHIDYKLMHSGAGHDSQIFAPFVPTAMLFVPSRDGISHNPAEFTEPDDLVKGVETLIGVLYELAYK